MHKIVIVITKEIFHTLLTIQDKCTNKIRSYIYKNKDLWMKLLYLFEGWFMIYKKIKLIVKIIKYYNLIINLCHQFLFCLLKSNFNIYLNIYKRIQLLSNWLIIFFFLNRNKSIISLKIHKVNTIYLKIIQHAKGTLHQHRYKSTYEILKKKTTRSYISFKF